MACKKLQESIKNVVEKLKLKIQKVQLTKWKQIQKQRIIIISKGQHIKKV